MLHLAFSAGLRVSELIGLRLDQLNLLSPATIHVTGKGRRERVLPLWKEGVVSLKAWLAVRQQRQDGALFLNAAGRAMTRSGFEYILDKHVAVAAQSLPSIAAKRVTPHVLRHSCAQHMLRATRDVRKVALWLGHASIQSTEAYLRADPTEKLEALAAAGVPTLKPGTFRPPDKLIAMLREQRHRQNYAE
jgi:site-specific recombinase XerD